MKRFETKPRVKRDSAGEPLVEKQYEAEEGQAVEEPVKDTEDAGEEGSAGDNTPVDSLDSQEIEDDVNLPVEEAKSTTELVMMRTSHDEASSAYAGAGGSQAARR